MNHLHFAVISKEPMNNIHNLSSEYGEQQIIAVKMMKIKVTTKTNVHVEMEETHEIGERRTTWVHGDRRKALMLRYFLCSTYSQQFGNFPLFEFCIHYCPLDSFFSFFKERLELLPICTGL